MDKCREAFEKNRFWIGIFKADVVFKSEIGEFGLYEALNSKVEAEYLVEFNNKWVIWYQCWQSRQAELDQQKLLTRDSELHLDAAKEEIERLNGVVDEKDKRIEELESRLKAVHALARMRSAVITADRWFTLKPHIKNAIKCLDRKEKALKGHQGDES